MVTTLPTQLSRYFRERVIALLNRGENIYSMVWTLGVESLLMLQIAAGHLNGSKTTIVK